VITQQKAISTDREQVEKKATFAILSSNAAQQTSKIAKAGDMRGAQVISKAWNRKMKQRAHSPTQMRNLDNYQQKFNAVYDNI
jgi:hypothetical protein